MSLFYKVVRKITPKTRKEIFLNAIVTGVDNAPTPLTREEFYLAKIIGRNVQIPTPLTRYEIYLARLAGVNVMIPSPQARLEYILTKACGVDVVTPTPQTREEIYWARYRPAPPVPTEFTVSYYGQDGSTLLGTETVENGGNASGLQDTPTKPDTEQYTYTFAGWSNTTNATTATSGILNNITADKSVYAAFSETEKTFTVTFYNGEELIYTAQNVSYNGTAVYSGTTPAKAETSEYTYTFAGWNANSSASTADADALTNVTADRTVYAIFTSVSKGYTVYFYNGETLLETVTGVPSGGTATYTGATPTSSQAGYIFSGWSPSNTNITADTSCYAQFEEDDMYESITDTWSQIITDVSNGTYSTKYHIGDTKKIDLGTEGEVIMTIVGIDTDDLADNSGKAPITWISKQLLKTSHRMNPPYQSGTEGTGALGGWGKTETRSYLKETVKPLIPEIVRNAIKPVKKYTRIYNVSEEVVNNVVTTDDVWIPSYKEVFGTGSETQGLTYSTAFPDNASRIKRTAGSSATWWWLRSASYTYTFYFVNTDGSNHSAFAKYAGGVALGFCT